jgi:GAF domain-containing protein
MPLIPLSIGGRAVGILGLYAADTGFFVDEEMRLLAELTDNISFALDHMEKAEKLDYLSYYDPVTGAPNRSLFHERLKLQLDDAARRTDEARAVDHGCRALQDDQRHLGRHAGDALLREIVARTERVRDPASWFARLGRIILRSWSPISAKRNWRGGSRSGWARFSALRTRSAIRK